MKLYSLLEQKNIITNSMVYHMTNPEGFIYITNNNILTTRSGEDISFTTNKNINRIYGSDFLFVKFYINEKKLSNDFGYYDYQYVSKNGQKFEEFEIRANTKIIENFDDYVEKAEIIDNIYGIYFLYRLSHWKTLFETLLKYQNKYGKLYISENEKISNSHIEYFSDVINALKKTDKYLYNERGRAKKLEILFDELSKKYDIQNDLINSSDKSSSYTKEDFNLKKLSSIIPKYLNMLSSYYYEDITIDLKKSIISKIFKLLNSEQQKILSFYIDKHDAYSILDDPFKWKVFIMEILENKSDNYLNDFMERTKIENDFRDKNFKEYEISSKPSKVM